MSTILPPSTSRTERNLATTSANAQQLPIPFRSLWSPWTCPTHLLPYLAASWSVDRWDDKWSETTKRQVIANSYFVHSRKGTIGAIRRVVEPLGFLIKVLEWWQETPNAAPGTFKLDIGVLDSGITETMYQELERLIADAKPMTRHLTGLAISMETRGPLYVGAACYLGDDLTIYPYSPEAIEIRGQQWHSGILHTIDTMTIQPQPTGGAA
ncbi:phage tail protein I [Aeromonas hydrophila]|uniref:phage tail protein I n=1 Tax=Aeromonas hydrophila TaxID=644 RepID=UPI001FC871C3|nr:phage tail protein I [Aeromonas hydrophila]GKQ96490.1 phage tail protein I [Aeromonas hydrophila]